MLSEDKILEILNDWNYWDKEFDKFIPRKKYSNTRELQLPKSKI